jgi:hypothetical protein
MTRATLRTRRRLVLSLVAVWLVAPSLLAGARWPSWWTWIAPEQTPMTWLQSVTLVLAAAAALLTAHVLRLCGSDACTDDVHHVDAADPTDRGAPGGATPWRLLAVGLAALAIDERFALHERLRDGVLAPRDVTVPFLPWVGPGDFLLLAVGVVGLAVLPMVWRAIGPDIGARRALLVGVTLAVVAVGMDSIDPSTWTTEAERVEQTAEEVMELGSALALLAAVTLRLLGLLDASVAGTRPEPDPPRAAEAPADPLTSADVSATPRR